MPIKNTQKVFLEKTYYHVYNRGLNKQTIFHDKDDYNYFERLLARALGDSPSYDKQGRSYLWLRDKLDLNAYCLLPNHFHMLIFQHSSDGLTHLMRSILTAYTMYFNRKYKRRGPLFESTYKAVPITKDEQLLHITRYIHLNPDNFAKWPYSSLGEYLYLQQRAWLATRALLDLFKDVDAYIDFMLDYRSARHLNNDTESNLAGY